AACPPEDPAALPSSPGAGVFVEGNQLPCRARLVLVTLVYRRHPPGSHQLVAPLVSRDRKAPRRSPVGEPYANGWRPNGGSSLRYRPCSPHTPRVVHQAWPGLVPLESETIELSAQCRQRSRPTAQIHSVVAPIR